MDNTPEEAKLIAEFEINKRDVVLTGGDGLVLPVDWVRECIVHTHRTAREEGRREGARENLISVGYYKGEMDFGVNCSVRELPYEEMQKLRAMACVAIGQAENMFRAGSEERNPSCAALIDARLEKQSK